MGVNFSAPRCGNCGGNLQRDNTNKLWLCPYCGTFHSRETSYDGPLTILHVARQAILAVAERKMDDAESLLVECAKIDPSHVATVVARLTFAVVSMGSTKSPEKRRVSASEAVELYQKLSAAPFYSGSEEDMFYEALAASDAYGLMLLVYDTLGDTARRTAIRAYLDADEIRSGAVARDMVLHAVNSGDFDLADKIMAAPGELGGEDLFALFIQRYPERPAKAKAVRRLAATLSDSDRPAKILDAYLADSTETLMQKLQVAEACVDCGVRPNPSSVISALAAGRAGGELEGDREALETRAFSIAFGSAMLDDERDAAIDVLITKVPLETALRGLTALKASGRFAEPRVAQVAAVLARLDLGLEDKRELVRALFALGLTERSIHATLGYVLSPPGPAITRDDAVAVLMDHISTVNPAHILQYLPSADILETKLAVLELLLSRCAGALTLRRGLADYLTSGQLDADTSAKIVQIFAKHGVTPIGIDVTEIIAAGQPSELTLEQVRQLKASGWIPESRSVDSYLTGAPSGSTASIPLMAELFSESTQCSSEALRRFVLETPDDGGAKPGWVKLLVPRTMGSPSTITCPLKFGDVDVSGNLLQAYILASPDADGVSALVAEAIDPTGQIALSPITVDGKSVKFRHFIAEHAAELKPWATVYCDAHDLSGSGLF